MLKHRLTKIISKHSKVALAVASALTGAVLGTVVQGILTSGFRVLEAVACVLCLGVIALIVTMAVITESQRTTNDGITKQLDALLSEVAVARQGQEVELRQKSELLLSGMKTLSAQFGLHVERLFLSEVNMMKSLEEDPSVQLIFSATEELCVLDLLSENDSMNEEPIGRFYAELIRRVHDSDPSFTYKRIVQVEDPNGSLAQSEDETFVQHCRSMLDLRATKHHHVSLRVTKERFPFKFMMMDRSHLVLQLQEYNDNGGFKILGEILISDPQSSLLSFFAEIWDRIDDDPQTRTVTLNDLPTLTPSVSLSADGNHPHNA
jgi:hypothetical protein